MAKLKKCVVWDLDNTVWDGVILEGKVQLRPGIRHVIEQLDKRGIIHSIASRNDHDLAMMILEQNQIAHLFVAPKINWLPKTTNILNISSELNISMDSIAFIDDDPFELSQVRFMLPDILTIEVRDAERMPDMPEFSPGVLTRESRARRTFYQADQERKVAEQRYASRVEFLTSCQMKLAVRPINHDDIPRVLELMTRTHQLNTTGEIFDPYKIRQLATSEQSDELVMAAELTDKFGWSGIIGTAIIRFMKGSFQIQFFAVSCRVLGRGIERTFLLSLIQRAIDKGYKKIEACYRNTGRNSMMRALYQMTGFAASNNPGNGKVLFELRLNQIPEAPPWVEVA